MDIKANAKINLSLDVVGKREDGYHLLEMIMQSIDLHDTISIIEQDKEITISCDNPKIPIDKNNLVYKAAKLFKDKYSIDKGVHIHIKKCIPEAAGLAGGSADAAAVLRGMRELFKKDISLKELEEIGVLIGADVPYCINGGTALCEGIGEIITKLPSFNNFPVVLVKPEFGVSTKDVYSNLNLTDLGERPNTNKIVKLMGNKDLKNLGNEMVNVLQKVTQKMHPHIYDILDNLKKLGATCYMMSGSGPTVFGIFEDFESAEKCFSIMREKYKEVYLTKTI